MKMRASDLSREAGLRISPEGETDGGRTYFEIYLKKDNRVVTRGASYLGLHFIIRGKDRRRHPRTVANDRRILMPGTQPPTLPQYRPDISWTRPKEEPNA